MENNLRGTDDMQTSIIVDFTISTEGLHHRLLVRSRLPRMREDFIAGRKDGIHIAVLAGFAGNEVAVIVRTDRTQRFPVILRVN